jgi:hypothetical protein
VQLVAAKPGAELGAVAVAVAVAVAMALAMLGGGRRGGIGVIVTKGEGGLGHREVVEYSRAVQLVMSVAVVGVVEAVELREGEVAIGEGVGDALYAICLPSKQTPE